MEPSKTLIPVLFYTQFPGNDWDNLFTHAAKFRNISVFRLVTWHDSAGTDGARGSPVDGSKEVYEETGFFQCSCNVFIIQQVMFLQERKQVTDSNTDLISLVAPSDGRKPLRALPRSLLLSLPTQLYHSPSNALRSLGEKLLIQIFFFFFTHDPKQEMFLNISGIDCMFERGLCKWTHVRHHDEPIIR